MPTAAQSRVSNNFAVAASSESGGSALQSWAVTPNGTITVNWVNKYWSPSGPVQVPEPASAAANIEALVPQSDGSITLLPSSATSTPGVFTVANVPAGNYWLAAGDGGAFWTSSATFDAGHDIAGSQRPLTNTTNTTGFNFSFGGIVPEPTEEYIEFFFLSSPLSGSTLYVIPPNSTTILTSTAEFGGDIDWSQVNTAFLMQYELETLGSLKNYVSGPELTLSNLALSNGTTNAISGTLNPATDTSLNLTVTGSQWASIFNNVGPATATVQDSVLTLSAEPYVAGVDESPDAPSEPALFLVAPTPGGLGSLSLTSFDPLASVCANETGQSAANVVSIEPPILTDQNFGALQYGDPFASTWTHSLAFCQQAPLTLGRIQKRFKGTGTTPAPQQSQHMIRAAFLTVAAAVINRAAVVHRA